MTLAPDTQQIESERLLLRRVSREDMPFFTRIHAIPDVARYVGHGRPRSVEESETWLQPTPKAWFYRRTAPPGAVLVSEPDLGYTFDPALRCSRRAARRLRGRCSGRGQRSQPRPLPRHPPRPRGVCRRGHDLAPRLHIQRQLGRVVRGPRPSRELPDGHGQGMSRWHRLPHIAPLLTEAGFNVQVGSCY